MPTFSTFFGIQGDAGTIAHMKGDIVSVLQAGCCAGALLINFMAGKFISPVCSYKFHLTYMQMTIDPFGRKWSIVLSTLVFLAGSVMQVAAQNLPTMMAGRFFGGCMYSTCIWYK